MQNLQNSSRLPAPTTTFSALALAGALTLGTQDGNLDGRGQRSSLHTHDVLGDVSAAVAAGEEPEGDSRIEAIAEAARRLDELGRNWLKAEGASEAELKKRTLTNPYNARPTWLGNAHERLDEAVFAAYRWPLDLTDEGILQNLLALNLERSKPERESSIKLGDHDWGFSVLPARCLRP